MHEYELIDNRPIVNQWSSYCTRFQGLTYFVSVLIFVLNILTFPIDMIITKKNIYEYFDPSASCGIQSLLMLINTYLITCDIISYKLLTKNTGKKLREDGYGWIICVQMLCKFAMYIALCANMKDCDQNLWIGTLFALNGGQFLCSLVGIYAMIFISCEMLICPISCCKKKMNIEAYEQL